MRYDFDKVIDRGPSSGSFSSKWEGYEGRFPGYQIDTGKALSMWVADMDFRCPDEVIQAIEKRAAHGIFGYPSELANDAFRKAAIGWFHRHYHWRPEPEWMLFSMGIVAAINGAIQEFSKPGDGVIIQSPVYYPFSTGIRNNGRVEKVNRLVEKDGYYTIDFEQFEALAKQPDTTMFILCSPHNPVGRVWTCQELAQMMEICRKNHVFVFADEIHADLIMKNVSFYSVGHVDWIHEQCVMAHAPSKTFNLAGLPASLLTVPDAENRERLSKRLYDINRIPRSNDFGPVAGAAAYSCCDDYAAEVSAYIDANMEYASAYLKENLPKVKMRKPEGTYLAWFDFRGLGLPKEEVYRRVLEEAQAVGDLGDWFGPGGEGFVRFNLACPRSVVQELLRRLIKTFSD